MWQESFFSSSNFSLITDFVRSVWWYRIRISTLCFKKIRSTSRYIHFSNSIYIFGSHLGDCIFRALVYTFVGVSNPGQRRYAVYIDRILKGNVYPKPGRLSIIFIVIILDSYYYYSFLKIIILIIIFFCNFFDC